MNKTEGKVLIITHSKDNDGHLSGALCQYFEILVYKTKISDIQYLRWSYGDADPDLKAGDYRRIYLLDLTLSPYVMDYLLKGYTDGDFIWIDHHKANYEAIQANYDTRKVPGYRWSGCAACLSTWMYWLPRIEQNILKQIYWYNWNILKKGLGDKPDIPESLPDLGIQNTYQVVPYWLYYISSYDTWKDFGTGFWENQVLPFEYYMRSIVDSPEGMYTYVKKYFDGIMNQGQGLAGIQNEIGVGKILLGSQRKHYKSLLGSMYEKDIVNEGTGKLVKVAIINTTERGSMVFENLKDKIKYDYYILWNVYERGKDTIFKYSAYSEKKDILVPDLVLGGIRFGGHQHAGGCVSKNKKIL